MTYGPITSWEIDGETIENMADYISGVSKITADADCSHDIKRRLLTGKKVMTDLVQFTSVSKSRPTLWDTMNCSRPGLPVHHQLPEFTQTHIHWVGDAIQPSPPLSSPSPTAPNPSQHQSLFQWVNSLHQVAKVLELQLQHQSFLWIFRVDFLLGLTGLISLQSKGLSRVFSNTTAQKHQFFGAQLSSQSNSHIHTWPLEKP